MAIKTKDDYLKSLENRDLKIYMFGELVTDPVNHPIIRPSINSVAMTYELANDPEFADVMTATSHLTGEKINRYTNIHQSTDDLINKVKMLRALGQTTCSCFQRCVGMDAMNAIYSSTYDIDQAEGTEYHKRFVEFVKRAQKEDLTIDGAMTDPKGDRSLRPGDQPDPDMFVHVVKETKDGIVVRGAKAHQTGCINSHEILVMPTLAMRKEDKDYAVSFAVDVETEGLVYIYGRQSMDMRKMDDSECGKIDQGNACFGGQEILVVFDDVFVPWERVFMCGEYKHSGTLVERFAGYHRQSYGGCKVGVGDVLIGAASLISEYNGTQNASHIKDKIVEMIHLNETMYACGIACSSQGEKTASGNYLVNLLLANVCKQNVTRFPFEISRILQDIAGGSMVTLPSAKDLKSPDVEKYVEKYCKGVSSVSTENRIRLLRFIENMCLGCGATCYLTESMHGAGSPQAQRIMMSRMLDIDARKEMVKRLAGIKD